MGKCAVLIITVFWISFSVNSQDFKNLEANRKSLTGVIETVVFDDQEGGQRQYLKTSSGPVPIFLNDGRLSNAKVTVKGILNSEGVIIPDKIEVLEPPEANLDLPVSGSRSTAVILLNFINDTSRRLSPEMARRIVFTDSDSANAYWRQASSGRLRLVGRDRVDGDVYGYLTLPFSNHDCTYTRAFREWTPAAAELAVQNGINLKSYQTIIYVFPQNMPGCPGIGIANVGQIGNQTANLIITLIGAPPSDKQTISHEIGHNLGLTHSKSLRSCPSGEPYQNCQNISEYGDYDVMGGRFHLLSNYNSSRLGWLSGRAEILDSPGIYYVSLISPNHPAKRVTMAQIRLKNSNGSFTGQSLYLESRRQMPPFDMFSSIGRASRGLSIRWASENLMDRSSPFLFDLYPLTPSGEDGMLLPGNTFTNSYYGFTISMISVSPMFGARVEIELTR